MSKQPPEPEKLKFSLRCLPCFQGPIKTEEDFLYFLVCSGKVFFNYSTPPTTTSAAELVAGNSLAALHYMMKPSKSKEA
ncbi:hypothetical protein GBA52_027391 [Prunus armeniaca]|nr:hypothetical protein GBA52_027391 [Prunus armeniaca]